MARRTHRCRSRSSAAASAAAIMAMAGGGGGRNLLLRADAAWIDPDTPEEARTTKSLVDGTTYKLIMSDEFNVPNRSFVDGHDPMWTSLDKPDDDYAASGGGSLHFYNSTMVTTDEDGMLRISSKIGKTEWNRYDAVDREWKHETKHYKSGMVQSWDKFCFTGGIVEFDVVLPGDPFIGGLWPAVWMLGNLGRATYLASTNNIWPWSYDTCDRERQEAQSVSACNEANHYGLNPRQGRGATEIDIIEGMMGDSGGPLADTVPAVDLPYVDMTLQVAPGIQTNRPQPGSAVLRNNTVSKSGHTELLAQTWYEGLETKGNTSLNPFFYGTHMDVTKKGEPVTRNAKQAFQADAVGSLQQMTSSHFKKPHTFRLEWQPGNGGRLDWFTKGYRTGSDSDMDGVTGDGDGPDWIHAYSIKHESINSLMGSVIPNEPSYLILNTAISSTWGFPYDAPEWCPKCYDCNNATCACAFNPGFCNMMKKGDVAMKVDHVRVYQTSNDDAHVGNGHTMGCDPPDFPTREYIKGHAYRYMRNKPFSFEDKGMPMKYKIQRGGGECESDDDCGGETNGSASSSNQEDDTDAQTKTSRRTATAEEGEGGSSSSPSSSRRGKCVDPTSASVPRGLFSTPPSHNVCVCSSAHTGPHCRTVDHVDDSPSAYKLDRETNVLRGMEMPFVTPFMVVASALLGMGFVLALVVHRESRRREMNNASAPQLRPARGGTMS
eukprot:CAMPEP_0113567588 /NCGR_PEP_ID=MMETSP0015_2-20120614/23356_1 /TAXON_ID=2838 /ORGANISM="Odontella" /LENGTH=717 /DNA_ID=CAMNT_0000469993 /DNA_START=237 /DNA_END=2390 /DNA_ORIENTATION=+ /assembly_acc=CAM_ASM_000160